MSHEMLKYYNTRMQSRGNVDMRTNDTGTMYVSASTIDLAYA